MFTAIRAVLRTVTRLRDRHGAALALAIGLAAAPLAPAAAQEGGGAAPGFAPGPAGDAAVPPAGPSVGLSAGGTGVSPAAAARGWIGIGRLMTNDDMAGRHDRWHTGAYQVSVLRGPKRQGRWLGQLPRRPGEILEFRLRAEALAPANLSHPAPGDRPYAGILSFGLHSHWARGASDWVAGLDLVAVGPQTGIARLHRDLHAAIGAQPFGDVLPRAQLGDRLLPTVTVETGRDLALAGWARLHPFLEARAGDETLLRAGADLSLGRIETGAIWSRDTGTGLRYVSAAGRARPGLQLQLGVDLAQVLDSAYLPGSGPARAADTRLRLRAGLASRAEGFGVFYGLGWLSRDVVGQPSGQLVGALRIRFDF
ncbi:lipid A-modifier LpxR family protein [Frigidibacter sp. MR17.24]|uniref:lipid A-modifier LpxR family protein n=1 Tax=Frigidibacter sp. MR17.24 TaxID=3127345 RepID=UPI003012B10C